jgi:hypothetical protein
MKIDNSRTDRERLPVDPHTGEPLKRRVQPGYYPGYHTLRQQSFWDAATRKVVLQRVREVPPIRFFTPEEARRMDVVCEHVLPQDDRDPSCLIPLLPFIDQRLHEGRTPGYRFAEMPPDGEAYRLGLRAIEQMARESHARGWLELSWREQEELLKSIHDAKPLPGAQGIWDRMPVERYWALIVQDCVEEYYAHPWSWDEIGYGGPAYPRAYMRLERGEPEPWEVEERRYEWEAPAAAVSDPEEPDTASHQAHPPQGQGGTH